MTMKAIDSIHIDNVDVIVVGAGASGMTAALVAANEGLNVLVLEKTAQVGGCTAYSAGVCWVPGSHLAQAADVPDTPEQVRRYVEACLGEHLDRDRMEHYLSMAPDAFRYLAEHSEVIFSLRAMCDYYPELPGGSLVGRPLESQEFDGKRLGKHLSDLRLPPAEFLVWGSLMVTAGDAAKMLEWKTSWQGFSHAAKLAARYLWDRVKGYPRGTRLVLGSALVARLYASLLQRKVPVWRGAKVLSLIEEGGRVVGVQAQLDQRTHAIRARKAVVLATGGFPHSEALRKRFFSVGSNVHSAAPEAASGDGISMALATGAVMGKAPATPAFWSPVSRITRRDGSSYYFPHLMLDRSKPGVVAVNMAGERFVNEAVNYHAFGLAMLAQVASTGSDVAYLVATQAHLDRYCFGVSHPDRGLQRRLVDQGYLLKADTLGELAAKMGVPAAALLRTIQAFNEHAAQGHDPVFGKGESAYHRILGDSKHAPNPCLAPLVGGAFFALRMHPGDIGTCHGLATDLDGQVLSSDHLPIPGLYACGNDMNSVMGGMYPGAGITLGPAVAFGYAVAMRIARAKAEIPARTE